VQCQFGELRIEDWLTGLRGNADGSAMACLSITPSSLMRDKEIAADRLAGAWITHLLAHASGAPVTSVVVGTDITVAFDPLPHGRAEVLLAGLLDGWREGMTRPLPVATKTAFAFIVQETDEQALDAARRCYDGDGDFTRGEVQGDPYLLRAYPDFDRLLDAGFRDWLLPYRALYRGFRQEADA
jgi:exodeoxyribonuclease V gamma subunit